MSKQPNLAQSSDLVWEHWRNQRNPRTRLRPSSIFLKWSLRTSRTSCSGLPTFSYVYCSCSIMGSRSKKALIHGAVFKPKMPCCFKALLHVAKTWLEETHSEVQFTTRTSYQERSDSHTFRNTTATLINNLMCGIKAGEPRERSHRLDWGSTVREGNERYL